MTKKNTTLELAKLFASYMVVFIHYLFYGSLGAMMDALARFAVPFFFLISGFFSYQVSPEKIKGRIKHLLLLLIGSFILYTLFNVVTLLLDGTAKDIVSYFGKYTNLKTIVKLLLLNVPVSAVHLWYMLALMYVYAIYYVVTVLRISEKAIFIISLALLCLHILLGEGLSMFGIVISNVFVRNFLFMGIPFFALGLLARKYEAFLHSIPNYMLMICIVIGAIETALSRYFIGKNELYIGSILIVFAVTALCVKHTSREYPAWITALNGCSTYVYILHIMLSLIIIRIYGLLQMDYDTSILLQNLHPLIVCILATILAYCIVQFSKILHRKTRESTHSSPQ